ncbi:potassium channel family protein [Solicola gregarius]|uniref:Potassium channel family protein n=1 Tax=Solicola gregarius TaxID=2908642 RepID=A0AA46TH91_9ACTN|nr:potassium channel family protein [Solicola gregarius]UYM04787.1 potassium channel family protein [Solicola gregarius]
MARLKHLVTGPVGRTLGSLLCALIVLYGFPTDLAFHRDVVGLLAVVAGAIGLSWLVVVQIQRMTSPSGRPSRRLGGVLSLIAIATCFFALTYFLIEVNAPAEFDGLLTRTDALYYSVVTLGTVGYGDIHAVGQIARVATIVQVVFNLVVIGALLAVSSSLLADRLRRE